MKFLIACMLLLSSLTALASQEAKSLEVNEELSESLEWSPQIEDLEAGEVGNTPLSDLEFVEHIKKYSKQSVDERLRSFARRLASPGNIPSTSTYEGKLFEKIKQLLKKRNPKKALISQMNSGDELAKAIGHFIVMGDVKITENIKRHPGLACEALYGSYQKKNQKFLFITSVASLGGAIGLAAVGTFTVGLGPVGVAAFITLFAVSAVTNQNQMTSGYRDILGTYYHATSWVLKSEQSSRGTTKKNTQSFKRLQKKLLMTEEDLAIKIFKMMDSGELCQVKKTKQGEFRPMTVNELAKYLRPKRS